MPRSAKLPRRARILEYLLLNGPGLLRDIACTELNRLVKNPYAANAWAAGILARALDAKLQPGLKKKIAVGIGNLTTQDAVDAAWQTWLDTRNSILLTSLRQLNRIAWKPAAARVYSILASAQPAGTALAGGSEEIKVLAEAACGTETFLAARAVEALRWIEKATAVDAICAVWAKDRCPILESLLVEKNWIARRPAGVRLLTCLLNNQIAKILSTGGEMVAPLISACSDPNSAISARALACLPALQSQPAIDAFCRVWNATRAPLLEKTLLQAHYLPARPFSLRLKAGFKIRQTGLLRQLPPQAVGEWLECLTDSDAAIRSNALDAAAELPLDTREEVCRLAIHLGDTEAMSVVTRHGFRPDSLLDQALLLFLQERWSEYALLDFDFTLLQTVYTAAPEDLRKRIADRVRSAGRPKFLTILSGGDLRYRTATYTPEEADTLVSILTSNRDYPGLWKLVPYLPLHLSITALRFLSSAGWQPENPSEQQDRNEWVTLASALPANLNQAAAAIPWALPCASLRVRGRINAISFAPLTSHLAVATGEHHLIVWDYTQASVQTVYSAFSHSLAHTVYGGSDLFCAERSTTTTSCSIYRCFNGQTQLIGRHIGPTTCLIPFGSNRLISTGRDGSIDLWHFSTSSVSEYSSQTIAWPRSALVTPDQTLLLTFAEAFQAWQLPNLDRVWNVPFKRLRAPGYRASPVYAAAVSPENSTLLTGQNNGRVLAYTAEESSQLLPRALLTTHPGTVRQISFIGPSSVLTAGSEGQIRVFSWPEMEQTAQVELPEGRLSTVSLSPDGAFMAAGGSESELTLWDLRMDRLRALLLQPLASCTATDLAFAVTLADNPSLNPNLRGPVNLAVSMLRFRFRFDVQIEETKTIRPGEFDIIL